MDDSRVFFYVDGIPTKGAWFSVDKDTTMEGINQTLVADGFIPADYGGDILAADAEGFARCFLGRYGTFDLETFSLFVDELNEGELAAADAYIGHVGAHYATPEGFHDAFCGEWPSMADYCEDFYEQCGDEIPDHLANYIDWDKMARDWEFDGYYTADAGNGKVFVFRNT